MGGNNVWRRLLAAALVSAGDEVLATAVLFGMSAVALAAVVLAAYAGAPPTGRVLAGGVHGTEPS